MSKQGLMIFLGCLVTLGLLLFNNTSPAPVQAGDTITGNLSPASPAAQPPLMQYQGKLLDKNSGLPKANATYSITFSVYSAATGGAALWSETESIATTQGLFSAFLGDQVALPQAIFDGRNLWLGITVVPDAEATPRLRVAHTAYALFSQNADLLDGSHASAFAASSHTHSAVDLISGLLSTDRFSSYADLIAESKIGSAADQVAAGNHTHDDRYVNTTGPETISASSGQPVLSVNQTSSGNGGQFSSVQGRAVYAASSEYVGAWGDFTGSSMGWGVVGTASGSGVGGYFSSTTGYGLYVNAKAKIIGDLEVNSLTYASPKTEVLSISGEAFVPANNTAYLNRGGMGGAYINSGPNALVATINLPNGAVITQFKVALYDNSSSNLSVTLNSLNLFTGGYPAMAQVSSAGTPGYYQVVTTNISRNPIDNTQFGYFIDVWCDAWDSYNLRIMGVIVTYTITEPH